MRVFLLAIALLFFASTAASKPDAPLPTPIEHVVVLMLENRAFDHMLGHLALTNPKIDGLTGKETNPIDPSDPSKGFVQVSFDQVPQLGYCPGHSIQETDMELWGNSAGKPVYPNPMDGFVFEMTKDPSLAPFAKDVMRCYNSSTIPVLSTLANSFAVFDKMYSSVPGPTGPNRMYSYSGTSHGAGSNIAAQEISGYPQRTVFDDLGADDFRVYFSDFPIVLEMKNMRSYPDNFKFLYDEFFDDVKKGDLPAYTWLEPRWFDFLLWFESDEHPHYTRGLLTGDVTFGELLIKDVYEALRNSSIWNNTLFIITYDEHGGTFDHVPPPHENVPNPDGINSVDPPFNFDRLGLRVPFVAISPWINAGVVEGEPAQGGHYDHTSLIGSLRKLFPQMPQQPLTKREAWAATYEHLLVQRSTPRTDCPTHLPVPHSPAYQRWQAGKVFKDNGDPATIEHLTKLARDRPEEAKASFADYPEISSPMTDLQEEAVRIAFGLVEQSDFVLEDIVTKDHGARFVRSQIQKWKKLHA